MKTDWSNYTIAYDGINYSVNYRDNGDLVACENYVANSPTPKNPQPLISNLPAGTYKTKDWKGDWWEFTLTEDLCGIGDVRDAVEWDKYGHKGFESRKIGQILSYTDEIIETAYMSTTGGLDTGAHICYVLATPTRTPLTFTKNNSSTAPECPPSLEYPAEVFDASGTVKVRGKNEFDKSAVTLFYYVDHFTGIIAQSVFGICVSEYIEVMPGQSYIASGINTASSKSYAFYNTEKVFISGGSSISIAAVAPTNAKYIVFTTHINDLETTMLERGDAATAYEPYRPEVTATIPPLRSNAAGTVCDEFEVKTGKVTRRMSDWVPLGGDLNFLYYPHAPISGHRFDIQNTVTMAKRNGNYILLDYAGRIVPVTMTETNTYVPSTWMVDGDNNLRIIVDNNDTGMPPKPYTPSSAEIKAYFYGWRMCHEDGSSPYESGTKHWKKLVGTEAEIQASITSTLPTASYEGFTPYKMIYELAEPIEEQHDPVTLPTYYPTTVITTTNDTPAELTTTATVKVEDEE